MHSTPATDGSQYPKGKSEEQWREQLGREEYQVLREGGTERPYTGEYTDTETVGVYSCRACGTELFRSGEQFHSHCGWPSFFSPLAADRIMRLARPELADGSIADALDDPARAETGWRLLIGLDA